MGNQNNGCNKSIPRDLIIGYSFSSLRAYDGVDNYGRLWTTMDKSIGCVLASSDFVGIVFN